MKPSLILPLAALALAVPGHASAQYLSERVEGTSRICLYRDGREHRVGLADTCSAYYPSRQTSASAPPSARLDSTEVRNGRRYCRYAQRHHVWTVDVSLETRCPLNAGMLPAPSSGDSGND